MTQAKRLLVHLASGRSITAHDALHSLGIGRLAARIHELRNDGHDIEREMVTVNTRYGSADVARYALVVKQAELELGNNGEPIKEYSEDDWRIDR